MISLDQVTVSFGSFDLLKDISFLVSQRDRVGLVGRNGAGKTTILRLFTGEMKPTGGFVSTPPNIRLGYLSQHMPYSDSTTVFHEAEKAFEEVLQIEKDIHKLTVDITARTDYETDSYHKLISDLSEKSDRYEMLGGRNREAEIEQTLIGLGFERSDFERATAEFSGGWRMRIELAKILLQKPDVLLLDEPTNHLDIESIQWLEDYLRDFRGAVLLISHDRTFLDRVTKRTVEITLGRLADYRVPYSEFLKLRAERREQQFAAYTNQKKKIDDTEKFIERFRYKASKSVQVQSRIKQLAKIDRIEIDEIDGSSIHIKFPPAPHAGTILVEAEDVSKSYGSTHVLDKIEMIIHRGEKVAFVGRNGEGKTTMARIIMGELEYEGNCKLGHNLKIGYYAQNQADVLDSVKTVLETIDYVALGDIRTKMRDILGAFLFSGDDIDKKVSVLSGGERSRLALACLLMEPKNLLVLDEPTNHLDLRSKQVLKEALLKFNGSLILVSHDRDFLDGLVTKIFEFRGRKVKEHPGDIFEFLNKKRLSTLKEIERKDVVQKQEQKIRQEQMQLVNPAIIVTLPDNKQKYEEKKEVDRQKRKLATRIAKAEERIADLEKRIHLIEMFLADPKSMAANAGADPYVEYEQLKKELSLAMEQWEEAHEERL
ncbi:MAG: ABC transporter ATP-binding protein [Porphyromonadaceae bacterium]|nr:MAG: ABC transporter ATP-binding protein [Porphyromonadaceae bacterium]